MSFEEIKTILIQYTSNTWFKSSAKAKNIEILNIEYSFASVYHLQCYNQSRQIKEKYCSKSMIFCMAIFETKTNHNSIRYFPRISSRKARR